MKLPLWRLLTGGGVLASLVVVLFALGPIYIDDFRLKSSVKSVVSAPDLQRLPDEQLRTRVIQEARRLDLPVQDGDITVTHPNGKTAVDLKYAVQVTFPLYNVDLHFHTSAQGK